MTIDGTPANYTSDGGVTGSAVSGTGTFVDIAATVSGAEVSLVEVDGGAEGGTRVLPLWEIAVPPGTYRITTDYRVKSNTDSQDDPMLAYSGDGPPGVNGYLGMGVEVSSVDTLPGIFDGTYKDIVSGPYDDVNIYKYDGVDGYVIREDATVVCNDGILRVMFLRGGHSGALSMAKDIAFEPVP